MQTTTHSTDTITAEATPPGRGGVAIVRVSGPLVTHIIQQVLQKNLVLRQATLSSFYDANGATIDVGVALFFPQPNSFTGEDVLELHGHGGPVVVDLLLQRIIGLGARLARAGEFSERAFLNGKMDLAQAEAVADLINASSEQAVRSAMRSLQGEFSRAIWQLHANITELRMYVEAAIDFSDEEIDFLSDNNLLARFHTLLADLATLRTQAKQGSMLREGITAVIVGAPNAGKSSLLNKLSGKDIAIVTDIPGTTRDILRDTILLDGMPIHILDTAGLRVSEDKVEQEGMRRAELAMQEADLILHVLDVSNHAQLPVQDPVLLAKTIFIENKIDLLNLPPNSKERTGNKTISLSVKTGAGLDLLAQAIKTAVGFQPAAEGMYLARRRHLTALEKVQQHVETGLTQLQSAKQSEFAAEELRLAQQALNEVTGEFTSDDLLGKIFSSFCIGK